MATGKAIGYGKLAAAGTTGAVVTIVISLLDHLGLKSTPELTISIQTVITAAAVWWFPHTARSPQQTASPRALAQHKAARRR